MWLFFLFARNATTIPVTVLRDGFPAPGLTVCAYRPDGLRAVAVTGETGVVDLTVPPLADGPVQITVSGHGHLPYLGEMAVGSEKAFCGLAGVMIGGDGLVQAGETVDLVITIRNEGAAAAAGVTATFDAAVSALVTPSEMVFGDIPVMGEASYVVVVVGQRAVGRSGQGVGEARSRVRALRGRSACIRRVAEGG